jgi:L-aminopeptidase/D-esterase-like protein
MDVPKSSTPTGITDVPGIGVGNVERVGDGYLTGCTVVLPPSGTVGAVAVLGGGPGTHETDALAPGTLTSTVDAVVLTGGSAYGLITAHGAQRWCEEHGRGVPVGGPGQLVPIVPAAVIFDLGRGGDFSARPDEDWGYQAAQQAHESPAGVRMDRGNVGAGCGAVTAAGQLKGGLGSASIRVQLDGFDPVVGAVAVVNSRGVPQLPGVSDRLAELPGEPAAGPADGGFNTTLAVVGTDAGLDVAQARRMALSGHDGLARAINPVHTLTDGDTVFGLATGDRELPSQDPIAMLAALSAVQQAGADAVERAVHDALNSAASIDGGTGHYPGFLGGPHAE